MSRSYRIHAEVQNVPKEAEMQVWEAIEKLDMELDVDFYQHYPDVLTFDGTIRLYAGVCPDDQHSRIAAVVVPMGYALDTSWWHEDRDPDETFYTEPEEAKA